MSREPSHKTQTYAKSNVRSRRSINNKCESADESEEEPARKKPKNASTTIRKNKHLIKKNLFSNTQTE